VVQVEREACRVLTNAGSAERPEVRTCRLPDLKRKLLARMNTAQDMHMNPVSTDDMVKILEGPLKGKQATVLHVHRGFLFARCREVKPPSPFHSQLPPSTATSSVIRHHVRLSTVAHRCWGGGRRWSTEG
jgi:hypothetical protein